MADMGKGLMRIAGGQMRRIGPPGSALCGGNGCVFCAEQHRCICYDASSGQTRFDFPVPTGVCALELLGRYICALSADADCLCVYDSATGAPALSLPAGVYPRALARSPCGRYLAIAGGASGEVWVLDRGFSCVQQQRVPGVACGVCFLPRALAVLCAVGESQLTACLTRISPRGVCEEGMRWDAVPCGLFALSDGGCLVGCHGEITCLRRDGQIAFRRPCPYPARMRPSRDGPLICDGWQGSVLTMNGRALYQGKEPADVYCP